jgi:hypothetical protein
VLRFLLPIDGFPLPALDLLGPRLFAVFFAPSLFDRPLVGSSFLFPASRGGLLD